MDSVVRHVMRLQSVLSCKGFMAYVAFIVSAVEKMVSERADNVSSAIMVDVNVTQRGESRDSCVCRVRVRKFSPTYFCACFCNLSEFSLNILSVFTFVLISVVTSLDEKRSSLCRDDTDSVSILVLLKMDRFCKAIPAFLVLDFHEIVKGFLHKNSNFKFYL